MMFDHIFRHYCPAKLPHKINHHNYKTSTIKEEKQEMEEWLQEAKGDLF